MVLAVCVRDVKFYDFPAIRYLGAYEVPAELMAVKSISWCCDGDSLAIVRSKGEPLVVRKPTKIQTPISILTSVPLNNAYTVAFAKTDPQVLTVGMENGEVSTVNLETKEMIRFKKLPCGVQNLDTSKDDRHVLAGCFDGQVFLYDAIRGRPRASFLVPNCLTLSATKFSPYSAAIMAAASRDGTLAVWNATTSDLEFACKEHTARITDLAFLENTVTTVGTDGFLCLFDLRTHQTVTKVNLDGALSSLAYFPRSHDLAVSTYNQLRSYDVRNLNFRIKTVLINNGGHIKSIAAAPDDGSGGGAQADFDSQAQQQLSLLEQQREADRKLSASGDCSVPEFETEGVSEQTKHGADDTERFVADYMKYASGQFLEKMAQSFYGLRIGTSKQFIFMGEKMEDSWNNFIAYLRYAGQRASVSCSKTASDGGLEDDGEGRSCGPL